MTNKDLDNILNTREVSKYGQIFIENILIKLKNEIGTLPSESEISIEINGTIINIWIHHIVIR